MRNKKHFKKIEKKIFKAFVNSNFVLGDLGFMLNLKFQRWLSENYE